MPAEITVDTRDFDRVFKEYLSQTSKTVKEAVASKTRDIVIQAYKQTEKADKEAITAQLNSPRQGGASLASLIVNKERAAQGLQGLEGPKMETAVKKLIAKRRRSVAFLKSGWIPALRILARYAEKKTATPKKKGRDKGGAHVFGSLFNPSASAWNEVAGGKHPSSKVTEKIEKALQGAINYVMADMAAYLDKKLQRDADKLNNH